MAGKTDIVVYFDHTLKNSQRVQTSSKFDGKVKDVVESITTNWYAFDPGTGRLVYNPKNKVSNGE